MAPEIEAGELHDMAADIWALGQIAYQLLCCKGKVEYLVAESEAVWGEHLDPLNRELIFVMTGRDPDKRPNINQVLEHPWFSTGIQEEE